MTRSISDFEKRYGVHFTVKHTGKMEGMISVSTSVLANKHCIKRRAVKGSICEKCFAASMMSRYSNLEKCLEKNTEILTKEIIQVSEMPIINAAFFRFESFGDLNNDIQVINYFNMAKANKHTRFALWTKNPFYIYSAIKKGHNKPRNLVIILSSPFINTVADVPIIYNFVDKVFTVYDRETAKNVNINCGARHCLSCLRCYKKTRNVEYVNEILK